MKPHDRKALRERQRAFRARRKEEGFRRIEVWVHATEVEKLSKYVKRNLRQPEEKA